MNVSILLKVGMVTIFLAETPGFGLNAGEWGQWGLAGMVIAFVLWRDWKREIEMSAHRAASELWVREKLLTVLTRIATAPCMSDARAVGHDARNWSDDQRRKDDPSDKARDGARA